MPFNSSALAQLAAVSDQLHSASAAQAAIDRANRTSDDIIGDAMKPWSGFQRFAGDPNYHGRTAMEWLAEEADLIDEIDKGTRHMDYVNPRARQVQDLAAGISREFGISERDALSNIYRVVNEPQGNLPYSFGVTMGLPSAAADERMGLGALELSGYDNPRLLNAEGNQNATDLQANFGDREFNIDSQKNLRRSRDLGIGALKNVEIRGGADRFLANMPGQTKMLDALHQLQSASRAASGGDLQAFDQGLGREIDVSGAEDKLLQSSTQRFNPNPSESYQGNEAMLRKDGLLVSDRDNRSSMPEFKAGPFDPTVADNMTLIDLEAMRKTLGDVTVDEFRQHGGDFKSMRAPNKRKRQIDAARRRGNQLSDVKLYMPRSMARQFQGDLPPLSTEAMEAFTRGRRR